MAISEIEKLERRFAENPQGFSFAPLAEAYRKSGDPERALGILQPGLELHPDYIPASIVLGRCQLDLGRDAEAEAAFGHVVGLDAENVIALKALADIAERANRLDEAATRLRQLLDVDRSNEDAQAQLGRVLAARQQSEAAAGAAAESTADDAPLLVEGNAAAFAPEPAADAEASETLPFFESRSFLESTTIIESSTVVDSTSLIEPAPMVEAQRFDEPAPSLADATPAPVADEPAWSSVASGIEPLFTDLPPVDDVPETSAADPLFGRVLPEEPAPAEDLTVLQLGGGDEIVLEGREQSEFQLPSVSDNLGTGDLAPAAESLASEYQLPDASADLVVFEADAGASEFQTPDDSTSLLADTARDPMVETSSEFTYLSAASAPAIDLPPAIASDVVASSDAPEVDEGPVGEWVTWSDAALDEDALPFEEPPVEVVPEPVVPEPVAPEPVAHAAPVAEPALETPAEAAREEPREVVPSGVAAEAVVDESVVESEAEPDLVVTESMAELFVRQGHAGDALRIYRELAGRRPGDARLVERIADLEAMEAAARAPSTPYAARVSGGTNVRDLMRSILAARPDAGRSSAAPAAPPPAAAARPVEPTRPAPDSISLSDVFGDEGSASPPAYRAPRAPAADKGVSFDDFFGAPPEPHASAARPRGPRPQADDLDQFHNWLQNLKR
jgi:thioredoxin-like negative regulator of GroEL